MLYKAVRDTTGKLKQEKVPPFMKKSGIFSCLFILMIMVFFCNPLFIDAETAPKFLIIHLDAVYSNDFFQYMEEGYLPNVKSVFENGNMIRYGLSLFPGGTEMIYPRLKQGLGNQEGETVGWGHYDRNKEKIIPPYKTFSDMFSHIPRRARASFIYGVPWLDTFSFLPMSNIPELLENYRVVEFIWFATDATGHVLDRKGHLDSIRKFDRYFGNLVKRLRVEEVNFVLYCDHGMCFDNTNIIDQDDEVKRIVGEDLLAFIFPNLYLKEPGSKDIYAERIVQESDIDFAFFKDGSDRVIGYFKDGIVFFEGKNEKYRYFFDGEDVFHYYKEGYNGEWLTDLEWLSLTRDNKFPAVPPNLYRFFSNQNVGDIVIVINSPNIIYTTPLLYSGHHHGFTRNDLLVPILLRGKKLEHLYEQEEMWLHHLFTSIPSLNFDNIEPSREKNTFSLWGNIEEGLYPGFELSLSPAYRWNIGFQYDDDIYKGWFEYDVYSSYVIRLWAGSGLQYQENNFEPFFQARLQMDFGKLQFNYGGQSNFSNLSQWEENRKEIIYRVNHRLSLNWLIPNRFGFTFRW